MFYKLGKLQAATVLRGTTMKKSFVMLALLLCGCANSNNLEQFRVADNNAKIFFFASYDSFADKPWFGEKFKLYIDGRYVGEVSNSQYMEVDIASGNYAFDVEEYGWTGTLLHHSTAKGLIPPGESTFLTQRIISNYNVALTSVDVNLGIKNIQSLTKTTDTDYSSLLKNQPHANINQAQSRETKGMLDIDPSQAPAANSPDMGDALTTGLAAYGQAKANSDAARMQALQNTPSIQNNTFIVPQDNRPHCSQYCQIIIDTGHVTANDPCAVQCR